MKILIVEDNPVTVAATESQLKAAGHEVDHAGNGLGGLTRMDVIKPDLVILDHYMPGMDGLTFLHAMRRHPKWSKIPVIIATAAAEGEALEILALSAPAAPVYVLRKPFEVRELLDAIAKLVGGGL